MNANPRASWLAFSFTFVAGLAIAGAGGFAQDPPRDDALDRLLEKAQDLKGEGNSSSDSKKRGEPEDKALDSLLEKLGQSTDKPETTGRPKAAPPSEPGPPRKDQRPDQLDARQKPLDEHLEELTGRRRRRPQDEQEQQKSDPEQGPISEAIKKMREVEQRLKQDDTGQETRKKQEEIVKDLEQLIRLARQMSESRQGQQRGNRPGPQQQGEEQTTNDPRQGTGPQKPKMPSGRDVIAQNKDIWGHLPPEIRAEVENMFREEALPTRRALIDRYYLSVLRKSTGQRDN